ncbi:MAG: site-specific integrase [Lachnospiraceae bacterium]|nr:site-specific integrase [Lachnospiraceae bacterium]
MSVRKEDNGTYTVKYYYRDGKTGKKASTTKRGFKYKKEAELFDARQKNNDSMDNYIDDLDIETVVEMYFEDIATMKEKSMYNKRKIADLHILNSEGKEGIASFRGKRLKDIDAKAVIEWQNQKMKEIGVNGKKYSGCYLRAIRKELSAILNHFEKVYEWKNNPSARVPRMGESDTGEVDFWTKEEFNTFIKTFDTDSMYYVLFEMLYYTGMRVGECLALTCNDILLDKKVIMVNKTYHRRGQKDIITSPKTKGSKREIVIPDFLRDDICKYIDKNDLRSQDQRLFPLVDRTVAKQLKKHAELAEVKQIHTHCLRHSHVALLIDMGEDMYVISKRLGHADIKMTMNKYGHLYPSRQNQLAERLEDIHSNDERKKQ